MTETVFNTVQNNNKTNWMFFGDTLSVSRFDVQTHPIFQKLSDKQLGFFWRPEEVALDKDSRDFKILTDSQKHIFISNLKIQTMLDSVQSRGVSLALLPHISIPELESCVEIWSMFESLHSLSYSHILRNIYTNPSEVFDSITLDENILDRTRLTIVYYDDFLNASIRHRAGVPVCSLRELKKKLLMCVASINALEGLSFYTSFACTFAFAEQGLMEGNAKIISLIARDESLHLAITQNIMKKWSNGDDDPEMAELYVECLPDIKQIYVDVIEQEKMWCKHLFKDGSMIGLNEAILIEFIEYMAGKRMKNLGIKTEYITKNPMNWMDKYLSSADVQEAPQEVELSSYIVGGVKNDVDGIDFGDFK